MIIEPIRSVLIPGYDEVKKAALDAGALGSGISGSGPSIFALSSSDEIAQKAGSGMKDAFDALELENDVYISKIQRKDSIIIEEY
ncbi:MAG: hypothetical protein U5K69_05700 [Balneolaceae bacterium]|nr:hypothetical protein [Balneolaceae bacterium]